MSAGGNLAEGNDLLPHPWIMIPTNENGDS